MNPADRELLQALLREQARGCGTSRSPRVYTVEIRPEMTALAAQVMKNEGKRVRERAQRSTRYGRRKPAGDDDGD